MPAAQRCSFCDGTFIPRDAAVGATLTCPGCGSSVPVGAEEVNPYAPPAASLSPPDDNAAKLPVARTSMLEKCGETFRLLVSNLTLFSLLIMTVWLPGNLLINYLDHLGAVEMDTGAFARAKSIIDGVFGPIYAGGILYALSMRKRGCRASYLEALRVGFRNWGRLFGNRLITGLFILLGLIVLVVPGIILMIRYALLDSVVILAKSGGDQARRRSAKLSRGYRWQIAGAGTLCFLVLGALSGAGTALIQSWESINNMGSAIVLNCGLDILSSLIPIVMFLIYWESAHLREIEVKESTALVPGT